MKKAIFITGTGRGIGREIAIKLSSEGYSIYGSSRTESELQETKRLSGGLINISRLDVTDLESVDVWINTIISEHKIIPWGLVTAAGIYGPIGKFWENDWDKWKRAIDINLFGTINVVRTFTQQLIKKKIPGRIVLLSGGGATKPMPNFSSYACAKSAVVRFGETLAKELEEFKITVNSIAPGAIATQLTKEVVAAGEEKAGVELFNNAQNQLNGTSELPDKAASLVNYLMSEDATNITGRLISAIWDKWDALHKKSSILNNCENYTIRRVVPQYDN